MSGKKGKILWTSVKESPIPDIGKYVIRYEFEGTIFHEVFNAKGGNLFWDLPIDGDKEAELDPDAVQITHWANVNEPDDL